MGCRIAVDSPKGLERIAGTPAGKCDKAESPHSKINNKIIKRFWLKK